MELVKGNNALLNQLFAFTKEVVTVNNLRGVSLQTAVCLSFKSTAAANRLCRSDKFSQTSQVITESTLLPQGPEPILYLYEPTERN